MSPKKIQAFFDGHAENWDTMFAPELVGRAAAIIDELAIPPGSRVLDVGAGTGVLFEPLLRSVGDAGWILAVDVSPGMLRQASAKTPGLPIALLEADAVHLPVAPAEFDWIVCYSVFPHFLDQQRALVELARALRPGGRLVVCHSRSREDINEHHRSVGDVVGGHVLPDEDGMRALVAAAGLTLIRLDAQPERYVMTAEKPATTA
ncbi:MAG: methyltransferase domain-containing protein [Candidatus Hydrogenedentes bacterium]|nr:methyltransferase domain-containing protein [Candidatus Hydrogenedentota bacterium]